MQLFDFSQILIFMKFLRWGFQNNANHVSYTFGNVCAFWIDVPYTLKVFRELFILLEFIALSFFEILQKHISSRFENQCWFCVGTFHINLGNFANVKITTPCESTKALRHGRAGHKITIFDYFKQAFDRPSIKSPFDLSSRKS